MTQVDERDIMSQQNTDDTDHTDQIFFRLDSLESKTEKMQDAIVSLTRSVDSLSQSVSTMQQTLEKYDKVEQQLNRLEPQVDKIETLWQQVDQIRLQQAGKAPINQGIKQFVAIGTSAILSAACMAIAMTLIG